MKKASVVQNTFMLYVVSVAKLILPLLTLPYLIRVFSEETYGLVAYVKSCMTYMLLIVDFGFLLSSVKDIVNAEGDKKRIGEITGNTFGAKLFLVVLAAIVMAVMCWFIPLLQLNVAFVALSFLAVAVTAFFADFLFRGIEKMHYITIVYVISKTISTVLTFIVVRGDADLLWIPMLDILSNTTAIAISFVIIRRLGIVVKITSIKECWEMLKESFVYFLSNAATTAFAALITVVIGIFLKDLRQIAYWGVCLSIVSAILGLYSPICNSVYPHMIKEKSLRYINKILVCFMPLVTIGCVICYVLAEEVLLVVGGEKYIHAAGLFRCMIPILFFSFPEQLYGWPTLGAIGKTKETTITTIIAAVVQVAGLFVLGITNCFTVKSMALLRSIDEAFLLVLRILVVYHNKEEFNSN